MSKVQVQTNAQRREFLFNKIPLADPDPAMSAQQVKEFYAGSYPELNNAEIEGPEPVGNALRYEFRKAVGTKGAEIDPENRLAIIGAAGLELIRAERIRQLDVKKWEAERDDGYVQHELASAACAYAAPEPLFNVTQYPDGTTVTSDCWPPSWDRIWDKRLRGQSEMHPNHDFDDLPFSADEYPIDQRIRNLVKAGALIAAEIDRLLRKKHRKDSGNV